MRYLDTVSPWFSVRTYSRYDPIASNEAAIVGFHVSNRKCDDYKTVVVQDCAFLRITYVYIHGRHSRHFALIASQSCINSSCLISRHVTVEIMNLMNRESRETAKAT